MVVGIRLPRLRPYDARRALVSSHPRICASSLIRASARVLSRHHDRRWLPLSVLTRRRHGRGTSPICGWPRPHQQISASITRSSLAPPQRAHAAAAWSRNVSDLRLALAASADQRCNQPIALAPPQRAHAAAVGSRNVSDLRLALNVSADQRFNHPVRADPAGGRIADPLTGWPGTLSARPRDSLSLIR